MLDLKIVGGMIVDGSGAPGVKGDVGVKDGRIVAVGKVTEDAKETVDATGRVVSPGFIDVHTHYDAQVFWEPKLSPSCFHGVTTVIGGFCGFSIAPLSPEASGYLMRMLARVEGMPLETLQEGVPWNWRSFGEYLSRFEGKIGLNAGFFAGHSAIRRVVMGERAVGHKATPEELEKMKALLDQSLAQGALGFSSTISVSHNDGEGNPVPSRWADHSEIVELGRVVSRHEGTGLELLPDLNFATEVKDLLANLSVAGQRAVNWNTLQLTDQPGVRDRLAKQLAVSDYARARGGEVLALTVPVPREMCVNFKTGMVLDINPGLWREIFKLPVAERIKTLRDPATRKRLQADVDTVPADSVLYRASRIDEYSVISVRTEKNKKYEGRRICDIAKAENRAPIDVMIDMVVDDELETIFSPDFGGRGREAYELRGKLWHDDRTLVGASDAGAHMDMIDTFAFSTILLEKGVREHKVISLEEAVYQLSHRLAKYMGLRDRGLLKPGYHADMVVFDPASVGRAPTYARYDVPGNQYRLYAEAHGVDHVFVNGVQIIRNAQHTGKLPGTVLRSGKDTVTVPIGAMREGRTTDFAAA